VDLDSRLLCGFAVWGMWGIITVQMLNLGFPFTQAELFTLTAIAGLIRRDHAHSGVVLHPPGRRAQHHLPDHRAADGIPAVGTGIALQHKDWPLWVFQLMALCRASAAATSPARCPTSAPSFPSACRARRWA
jgi:NNP family nitrate/nitrite transporter-like MFS transporter